MEETPLRKGQSLAVTGTLRSLETQVTSVQVTVQVSWLVEDSCRVLWVVYWKMMFIVLPCTEASHDGR